MTVRTTLSFTDRHHTFMMAEVEAGVYATQSALVADAIENLIRENETRIAVLDAMTGEIRRRLETPREEYLEWKEDDNPVTRALEAIRQRR